MVASALLFHLLDLYKKEEMMAMGEKKKKKKITMNDHWKVAVYYYI